MPPATDNASSDAARADAEALDVLRRDIERTDGEIVELVRRRAALAARVGEVKRRLGRPIVDAEREREVERMIVERGAAAGLPEPQMHSLARALIELARAAQGGEEGSR